MGDTTEVGLPRVVAIAWGMHTAPTKGPSRGLSHERIVSAGVQIADDEGLSAVTMQRVAQTLGFTTMSLYRYISGKEELLELMLDAAGELPASVALEDDWAAALRQWAQLLWDTSMAHPWTLELPRTQVGLLMPNSIRVADLGLGALGGLELDEAERVAVILTVSQHVLSMVQLRLSLAREGVVPVTPEAVQMLGSVVTPERFPVLGRMIADGEYVISPERTEDELDVGQEYEFGLERIIAGIGALLDQRGGSAAD